MGPLEAITAALKLADTLAQIRLIRMQAYLAAGNTAAIIGPDADADAITDLRGLATKLRDDADKVGKLFSGVVDKIHDAIHDDKPA